MRITAKGQVTIPIEIRERLRLAPNTEVEFELSGSSVLLRRATRGGRGRGRALVDHLRGKGNVRMSTAEIIALTRT